MFRLLSSTVTSCSKTARDKLASVGLTRTRTLTTFASVAVLGLAIACSETTRNPVSPLPSDVNLGAPVFAVNVAGNGTGACLTASTDSAGFINNVGDLNCTSEDVDIAFATITQYSINGSPFVSLPADSTISCVPGDVIRAVTTAFIENNAQERYDLGLWINPTPGGSAKDGSSCLHYNLIPGQGNSTTEEDGGNGGTPDACGDVAAGVTVSIPLDTLTLTCPSGGQTSLALSACAAWQNGTTGGGDRVCPLPGVTPAQDGFRFGTTPGTTAKCRCEPLVLPIDVKGVIRVDKVTVPAGSSTSFTFTPSYNGGTTFNLTDAAAPNVSPPLSAGTYTVAETVPAGWTLTSRACVLTGTSTAVGSNITNGVSIALTGGQDVTCTFTNTQDATLTVNKVCNPTSDTGRFNLRIDGANAGTGADAACGGTTGAVVVAAGSHTVGETAGTSTDLNNYTSAITGDCATNGSVTVAAGQNKVCTITNTRKPKLTVNKVCNPTGDAGHFNLLVDAATFGTGTNVACGGTTGAQFASIGSHTVSETAAAGTTLTDYGVAITGDCASNGSVTLAAGDNKTCTITNTRAATLQVNKVCNPTSDTGHFNLLVDAATFGTGTNVACGGTTGAVVVATGSHTVSETAAAGTDLANYTSAITGDCATNGSVTLAAGDHKVCTITNTRKPTLRVNKVCNPTSDTGHFNLLVDAATFGTGTNVACGGTTGVVISTIGSHTVSETAAAGTDLANYTSAITGDCATNGSVTLAAGDNKVCTITNTRKPTLRVNKVCAPTSNGGHFNLLVDAATFGTGTDVACGGTTGVVVSSIGTHTVSETAGTNTDLANYATAIGGDCATSGSVTLAAGDNKVCTITNSRKAVLIVDKVAAGQTQLFDFSQTGIANFQLADATTPKKTINISPSTVTVCELALAVAWNVTVTVNGSTVSPTINGTTGDACYGVVLNYGDSTTIVFTNTPPPGGGTRTIGYWKNHSSCATSNGGQYQRSIDRGEPEANLDFYLGGAGTQSIYPIGDITSLNCTEAVNLLSKNAKNGDKRAGDPIYNMVAQLLGAKLNVAAGAGTCATLTTALTQAQAFLDALNFDGTGSYKGVLSASDQTLVNNWAAIFGSYNEGTLGGGCPTHI